MRLLLGNQMRGLPWCCFQCCADSLHGLRQPSIGESWPYVCLARVCREWQSILARLRRHRHSIRKHLHFQIFKTGGYASTSNHLPELSSQLRAEFIAYSRSIKCDIRSVQRCLYGLFTKNPGSCLRVMLLQRISQYISPWFSWKSALKEVWVTRLGWYRDYYTMGWPPGQS